MCACMPWWHFTEIRTGIKGKKNEKNRKKVKFKGEMISQTQKTPAGAGSPKRRIKRTTEEL